MTRKPMFSILAQLFGQQADNVLAVDALPRTGVMSLFDVRSLMPRERRRLSPRENAKGVVGNVAGRAHKNERKHARRRLVRRALRLHNIKCAVEEPAGSKHLRRFARNAGLGHDVTYEEAREWYGSLQHYNIRVGHRGFHPFQGRYAQ